MDVLAASATIVALGAAAAVLAKVGRFAHATMRKIVAFLDDWHGTPERPGFDATPGVPARLAQVEERLERVEDRVTTNGGGSMSDAVDRIEQAVAPRPRTPQSQSKRGA